ncbi:MAG: cell shape-determining protein, partial [Culicoidibacterales bacterium]
ILVNVQGKPTYFMTLKDNEGLVKRYAYVSVENYNNVGVGSTINEAQKDYVRQLTQDNQITTPTEGLTSLTAVVERIETVIIDSQSLTYLKVADNKTLFIVSPETSAYAPVTKIGDTVELKYLPAETSEIIVNEFTNTSW